MNLTAIIGLIAAFGVMVYGILGSGNLMNFYNFPSILITIGGALAILVASTPARILTDIPKHLKVIFAGKKQNAMAIIDTIVDFAQIARRSGLLALEERANQETDEFLKSSILQIVDGVDAGKVRAVLEANIDNVMARHEEAAGFYDKGAALGPAFGMIGTLIGLINMLKGLNVEAEGAAEMLGDNMSVALVTTFYGSVLANAIFMPLSNQLKSKSEEEYLCKVIIMEGVLSIQAGENPKYIREKLESLLSQKTRDKAAKKGASPASPESTEQ